MRKVLVYMVGDKDIISNQIEFMMAQKWGNDFLTLSEPHILTLPITHGVTFFNEVKLGLPKHDNSYDYSVVIVDSYLERQMITWPLGQNSFVISSKLIKDLANQGEVASWKLFMRFMLGVNAIFDCFVVFPDETISIPMISNTPSGCLFCYSTIQRDSLLFHDNPHLSIHAKNALNQFSTIDAEYATRLNSSCLLLKKSRKENLASALKENVFLSLSITFVLGILTGVIGNWLFKLLIDKPESTKTTFKLLRHYFVSYAHLI